MKLTDIDRVPYGSKDITFALEYFSRKTVAIEVHPNSSIIAKAPIDATIELIESKVIHRVSWIARQQCQFSKYVLPLPC